MVQATVVGAGVDGSFFLGDGLEPFAQVVWDGDEPSRGRLRDLGFDPDKSGSEVHGSPIQAAQLRGPQSAKGSDGQRGDQVFGAVVQQFAEVSRAKDPGFGGSVAPEVDLGDFLHQVPVQVFLAAGEMQQGSDQPKQVVLASDRQWGFVGFPE